MNISLRIVFHVFLVFIFYSLSHSESTNENYVGEFYEWEAKSTFSKPDQIRIDPFDNNVIWFTQPRIHGIARFDYNTKVMTEFDTEGKYRPDGLVIDEDGILWFGEQSSGTLGRFDPDTEDFEHYSLPYKNANPAIPTVDHDGFIWVSDHVNNKIVRFDPEKKRFLVIHAPTPKSWVVDLKTDSKNRIWYSCYHSDRIGVIDKDRKTITEYQLPEKKSGPSFLVIDSKDQIWFTMWKSNKIGKFDPVKEVFVEYMLPIYDPGPAAVTISDKDVIYFSTKRLNSIIMLDSKNDHFFYSFKIPTPKSGQKDGITIDENNVVWFTQFDKNKISRLEIFAADDRRLPGDSLKNRTLALPDRFRAHKSVSPPKMKKIYLIKRTAIPE